VPGADTGSTAQSAAQAGEAMTRTRSQRDRVIAECGARPGAVEDYPFGDDAAVFKVAGKMFALVSLGQPPGPQCVEAVARRLRPASQVEPEAREKDTLGMRSSSR
jgi:YjbR